MPIIGCDTCDNNIKRKDKPDHLLIKDEGLHLLELECTCSYNNSCMDKNCAWYIGQLIDLRTV